VEKYYKVELPTVVVSPYYSDCDLPIVVMSLSNLRIRFEGDTIAVESSQPLQYPLF